MDVSGLAKGKKYDPDIESVLGMLAEMKIRPFTQTRRTR